MEGDCKVRGKKPDSFEFTATLADETRLAFHYPYGFTQVLEAVARWAAHPDVQLAEIAHSVEGRPIHHLTVHSPLGDEKPMGVWVTCRQHAAESVANWFLEGFMDWLLSPEAAEFRRRVAVHVVPMLNPDGVIAGNYRANAEGVNLNRVWNSADPKTSPEIHSLTRVIRSWHERTQRYDFYIDLHGDSESLACYAFQAGAEMKPPAYREPERYHEHSRQFIAMVAKRSPDFDPNEGIVNTEDVNLSRQYMMFTYGVMAQLFENGYSTVNYGPNKGTWLTPERHKGVGRAAAEALAEYLSAPRK